MHASITHLPGDPDDLEACYDALLADVPTQNMQMHLCLRAPDGLLIVDTCPTREAFQAFQQGEPFRILRARHGLPTPDRIDDYPVHVAFAAGAPLAVS